MSRGLFPRGSVIISCQAPVGSPLRDPGVMGLMARAAVEGGAAGIRAEGTADIAAIRRSVDVPIIGLIKRHTPGTAVYITPELADAVAVAQAGADAIALDATLRPRPGLASAAAYIQTVVGTLGLPVVADVDSVEAAAAAERAGASFVATTLAGYTGGPATTGPDIDLVARCSDAVGCPVLAEGRYHDPAHIEAALRAGAHAVVVGTAVTDPIALTRRLVSAAETVTEPTA